MAGARFVLVSDITPTGVRRATWPNRSGLEGTLAPDRSWVAWRLLGRNNHELGRSAFVHAGTAQSLLSIERLLARSSGQETRGVELAVLVDSARGEWRWRLSQDGEPVAAASRAYLRRRECQYSAAMFLHSLADAALPAGIVFDVASLDGMAPARPGRQECRS